MQSFSAVPNSALPIGLLSPAAAALGKPKGVFMFSQGNFCHLDLYLELDLKLGEAFMSSDFQAPRRKTNSRCREIVHRDIF